MVKPLPKLTEKQIANFQQKLKRVGDCLEWCGARTIGRGTYGKVRIAGILYRSHRIAYFLATGIDPGYLKVCHRCDNSICCEPQHLFEGTQPENIADRTTKGRTSKGTRHYCAKLSPEIVREIRSSSESDSVLSARFHVACGTIFDVRSGRTWTNV